VVLYGYETWPLTLREEHKLRVFENRVLGKIFGHKEGEIIRGWRKVYDEELHNLYSSPYIIRMIISMRMRWTGDIAHIGKKINAYRILVVKPKGKQLLGRTRRRWEDNIKMDLKTVRMGWYGLD
jgi:hypothetical protein